MKVFGALRDSECASWLQWPRLTILRRANLIQRIDCINPLITIH